MLQLKQQLFIGYHGTSKKIATDLINTPQNIKFSHNDYDWLGNGFYIWEYNYKRALTWADNRYKENAAVVGIIYILNNCFDLTEQEYIDLLKEYYSLFEHHCKQNKIKIPENLRHKKESANDNILRYLDCSVIEFVLGNNLKENRFDSVRSLFIEGNPIYQNAGFYDKTHIQVCLRNKGCIKGVFKPII